MDNKNEQIVIDNGFLEKECYSREDIQFILDTIPFGISLTDTKGNYIFKNKSFKQCITDEDNYSEEVANLKNIYTFENYSEDNKKYLKSIFDYIINNKKPLENEEFIDIKGKRRWFEAFRNPILDEDKEVKYIFRISKDITIQKNIENEITRGISVYQELLSMENNTELIPTDVILNILSNIIVRVGGDSGDIWLYNREGSSLTPIYNNAIKGKRFQNSSINIEYDAIRDYVNKNKYSSNIDLYENEFIIDKELFLKEGIRHLVVFNLEFNNEVTGFITIHFNHGKIPNYRKDNFLNNVSSRIAALIYTYKLALKLRAEFKKRKELEKELNDFLETGVDLMVITDTEGNFLKFNKRWTSVLGWTEEELFSMKWQDIVYKEDLKNTREKAYDENEKSNVKRKLKNRYITKDGKLKWLAWNYKFVEERNVFIGTARDITEEVEFDKQRKIFEEALQLEAIKSEFFANISHEFKTPLNIILATVQLINTQMECNRITVDEGINLNKYIKSIKQNSYRLLRLVNNLIDLTKIDTGFYNLNLGNYNVVSIIEDISMSVAQYVENKDINLVFDTEIEELTIACDPDKIERIMLNLISNAIKYTKANGNLLIYLSISEGMLQVSVKDDGCGISKEKLNYIFQRFVQIDNTLNRCNEGSGIGLALVKSLVEMHEGTVRVNSEEGEGSEFIFTLPLKTVEEDLSSGKEISMVNNNIEKCNIEFSDIYYL